MRDSIAGDVLAPLPTAAACSRTKAAWFVLLLGITVVGAALRAHDVVDRPLWEDESYTWKDAQLPYARLVWWKYEPHQGPLGYLAVRHAVQVFGTDAPWALRMPSLVCGILCMPAAYWLGRIVHSRALGAIAAAIVAVDPNLVDQSQQARMYTMLALVWIVALGRGIVLLREPPEARRPWVLFGLLLALLFHVNFAAVAFWSGLGMAAVWLTLVQWSDEAYRRRIVRGLATALGLAAVFSVRGIYRFVRFVADDHAPGTTSALERLRSLWNGLEQLLGAGTIAPLAAILAIVGLFLLARRCRASAVVIASTGLMATLMIYRGQSVHDVFAVRYFTSVEPAVWIGLAAFPVLAATISARALYSAVLVAFCAMQTWQCAHLEHWNDFKLWNFARAASQFVHTQRGQEDRFSCAPNVHLKTLARYYGLSDSDTAANRPVWMMAFMFNGRSEQELRRFLEASANRGAIPVDIEKTISLCKERGHVVLRLDTRQIDVWEYEYETDRLRMLPDAVRSELARAPVPPRRLNDRERTIR